MDYSAYFDIPKNITYLNTAGNGLLPITHKEWRSNRDEQFFDTSSDLRSQQDPFMAKVKLEAAQFFNCEVTNLYALPNFAFGQQMLLAGLPKNLRLLLIEGDYPSLNYPAVSQGFDLQYIRLESNLEEKIYALAQKKSFDVLMLSVVQYISGFKIDLAFIKKLKADFPDILIIGDATQYLGTASFDFKDSGFDAIGASGYKWLLSGYGNGYLMLSDQMKTLIYADAQKQAKPVEPMWSHKSVLDTIFEPGHQDTLSHGTFLESMKFFNQIGLDNINQYITSLSEYAYHIFEEEDWLLSEIKTRQVRSSLISVQINPDLYPYLLDNGIKCFPRGKGIRIALHLYNNTADIDKFVSIVKNRLR